MLQTPVTTTPPDAPTLAEAYRVCRTIARREAKNFYYAFLALPRPKHNAICAVYAFMRHADDLADDESLPHPQRLQNLQTWSAAWRQAAETGLSAAPSQPVDPVFLALNDARQRYNIPLQLLDELVQGTAMDLNSALNPARNPAADLTTHQTAHQTETYPTFNDLYRYCYLVASVVGLVCIRIFEYSNPAAEKLAEELGIAFQLTNILRDVREDAEHNRIYLPLDDLATHNVPTTLLTNPPQAAISPNLRHLLRFEAQRAQHYYQSGTQLLPLIAPDSRPALWVLMTIYHRLLTRIEQSNYDVFSTRIRVPAWEKLAILTRGLLELARYRLLGAPKANPS
jgi:phytoene synthase